MSRNVTVRSGLVGNPYASAAPAEVTALRSALRSAADHFPVSADLTL